MSAYEHSLSTEDELTAFGHTLTREQRAILRELHNALGFMCEAASDGVMCCIHTLLDDTEPVKGEYSCMTCGEFIVYDEQAGRWHNGTRYICQPGTPVAGEHSPPPWITS